MDFSKVWFLREMVSSVRSVGMSVGVVAFDFVGCESPPDVVHDKLR